MAGKLKALERTPKANGAMVAPAKKVRIALRAYSVRFPLGPSGGEGPKACAYRWRARPGP